MSSSSMNTAVQTKTSVHRCRDDVPGAWATRPTMDVLLPVTVLRLGHRGRVRAVPGSAGPVRKGPPCGALPCPRRSAGGIAGGQLGSRLHRGSVPGWYGGREEVDEQLVDALGLVVVHPVGGA